MEMGSKNHLSNFNQVPSLWYFDPQAWPILYKATHGYMTIFETIAHYKNPRKIWIQIELDFIWKSTQKIKIEKEKEINKGKGPRARF